MRDWLFILWAFAMGMLPVAQSGINARLGDHLGGPLRAALVNFLIGGTALVIAVAAFSRGPIETSPARIPWWNWLGGLCGAAIVLTLIVCGARLGATLLFALVVTGQVIWSVVIDWQGWFGYEPRPLPWMRLVGVGLLIAGVVLVTVFQGE